MTLTWRRLRPWTLWPILLAGLAVGFVVSWWINRPPPPWLVFESLTATYELGRHHIALTGVYDVNRVCATPVSWYQEALATDGQIALYGPRSEPPDLRIGRHDYHDRISLTADIFPDGWKATIIARCESETISSPSARVIVAPPPPGAGRIEKER